MLKNQWYDRLKFVALIVLPAFSVFYLGFAEQWGLGNADKVAGTASLLAAFLGALLQISNSKYKKQEEAGEGEDVVGEIALVGRNEDTGHPDIAIKFNDIPDEIIGDKKVVKMKVDRPDEVEEH